MFSAASYDLNWVKDMWNGQFSFPNLYLRFFLKKKDNPVVAIERKRMLGVQFRLKW